MACVIQVVQPFLGSVHYNNFILIFLPLLMHPWSFICLFTYSSTSDRYVSAASSHSLIGLCKMSLGCLAALS